MQHLTNKQASKQVKQADNEWQGQGVNVRCCIVESSLCFLWYGLFLVQPCCRSFCPFSQRQHCRAAAAGQLGPLVRSW